MTPDLPERWATPGEALPPLPDSAYPPGAVDLPEPEPTMPAVPPRVRTVAYLCGIVLGLGIAPALLSVGQTEPAGVAAALSGAANAIAFGNRPTR